jgi:hypothetical protein
MTRESEEFIKLKNSLSAIPSQKKLSIVDILHPFLVCPIEDLENFVGTPMQSLVAHAVHSIRLRFCIKESQIDESGTYAQLQRILSRTEHYDKTKARQASARRSQLLRELNEQRAILERQETEAEALKLAQLETLPAITPASAPSVTEPVQASTETAATTAEATAEVAGTVSGADPQ